VDLIPEKMDVFLWENLICEESLWSFLSGKDKIIEKALRLVETWQKYCT
jgi:hypothetical protein